MSKDGLAEAALIMIMIVFSLIGVLILLFNLVLGIGYFLGFVSFMIISYVIVFIFSRYIGDI